MKLIIHVDIEDPKKPDIIGILVPDDRKLPPIVKPKKTIPDEDGEDILREEES